MNRGIVYIALGTKYLEMAVTSAMSLLRHSPNCPEILIFTDCNDNQLVLSDIRIEKLDPEITRSNPYSSIINKTYLAGYIKTQLDKLSPFDVTLYLDCDILAVGDIDGIWDYVGNGLSLAPAFSPVTADDVDPDLAATADDVDPDLAATYQKAGHCQQYNAGVILFNKSKKISKFFRDWAKEWMIFEQSENTALIRCLVDTGLNVNQLPSKYNEFYPWKNSSSKLIHYIGVYKNCLRQ
jgi:lipopolysaccharide biosynthesis glycosyltransferase